MFMCRRVSSRVQGCRVGSPITNARAGLLTKRTLVIASHAVERAALAGLRDEPMVVLAMFQRLPYFEREAAIYQRIAALTPVAVVGMVSSYRPDLPPGVTPVLLRTDEDLAREWSVVVLSATFGACVVATDLEELDLNGTALEPSRLFRGRWGFRREEAYAEVVRLRDALGDRLPVHVRTSIDDVLARITTPPAVEIERRTEAAMQHLASRVVASRNELERVAEEARRSSDPWTGLHTADSLAAWLGDEVTDTVGLAWMVIVVPELRTVESTHSASAAVHTENNIADVLRSELRPIDQAARLSGIEFLMVLPGVSDQAARATATRVVARLAELHNVYPHVAVTATARVGHTSERPFDVSALGDPGAPQVTSDRSLVLSGTFEDHVWATCVTD